MHSYCFDSAPLPESLVFSSFGKHRVRFSTRVGISFARFLYRKKFRQIVGFYFHWLLENSSKLISLGQFLALVFAFIFNLADFLCRFVAFCATLIFYGR